MLKREGGAVLIVGLIMLLLMTIVGLSAIRGSNLQELMAGGMRDRHVSFQASEAGLRSGELVVGGPGLPNTSGGTTGFSRAFDHGGTTDFWFTFDWGTASAGSGLDLKIEAEPARYVVEQLDVAPIPGADGGAIDLLGMESRPDLIFYRITSRGVGMTTNTTTFAQSIYRRQ